MPSNKQSDGETTGTDKAVLGAIAAFTAVGNVGYLAGALSGVSRANPAGLVAEAPIIGWAWVGFADMWHSGAAGAGACAVFWLIMVIGTSALSFVAWRLWRKKASHGGGSRAGGMTEDAAARHNAKLGVQ